MILRCETSRHVWIAILLLLPFVLLTTGDWGILGEANATIFFEEGFDAGTQKTFLSQYYGSLNNNDRYSIQSTVKNSGVYALRYHFVSGTSNVSEYVTQHFGDSLAGPVDSNGLGNHYNDIYVQFKVYYSSGYDWSAGNNKIMIIGTQDNRSHGNVCCNPWVSHYITILAGNIGQRGFLNAEGNNKKSVSGQWFGLSPNVNGYNSNNKYYIDPDKWYTIEVHKRLNNIGENNGIFEMWVDGLKIAEYYDVVYRIPWDGTYGANFDYGTNFVILTTYINQPAPQDQDIYYDDVKFSTTYIGVTGIAPTSPTNLRIID